MDSMNSCKETAAGGSSRPVRNCRKVIFIGDSFIYYGQTVLFRSCDAIELRDRTDDHGYFYQLCRANGENAAVTNWTFGSHGLASILIEDRCACSAKPCYGKSHKERLTDMDYDAVVISPGRHTKRFPEELTAVRNAFTSVNPDVVLICLCSSGVYGLTDSREVNYGVLNDLKTAEQMGYRIADWGGLVSGIAAGTVAVPDTPYRYDKNTFIVRRSRVDGHHPNQLAGYMTTLMTYCALTGRKAEGQAYAFCGGRDLDPAFDTEAFVSDCYRDGAVTNYPDILHDPAEILRLQKLIDRYMAEKSYRRYRFDT